MSNLSVTRILSIFTKVVSDQPSQKQDADKELEGYLGVKEANSLRDLFTGKSKSPKECLDFMNQNMLDLGTAATPEDFLRNLHKLTIWTEEINKYVAMEDIQKYTEKAIQAATKNLENLSKESSNITMTSNPSQLKDFLGGIPSSMAKTAGKSLTKNATAIIELDSLSKIFPTLIKMEQGETKKTSEVPHFLERSLGIILIDTSQEQPNGKSIRVPRWYTAMHGVMVAAMLNLAHKHEDKLFDSLPNVEKIGTKAALKFLDVLQKHPETVDNDRLQGFVKRLIRHYKKKD
jgi:hypothetical protein